MRTAILPTSSQSGRRQHLALASLLFLCFFAFFGSPSSVRAEGEDTHIDFARVNMRPELKRTLASYLTLRWQGQVPLFKHISDEHVIALIRSLDSSRSIQRGGFAWCFDDAPDFRKTAGAARCTSEARYLAELAKYLRFFSTKDDLALGAILADLALAFDPDEPLAKSEAAALPAANWSACLPEAPDFETLLAPSKRNATPKAFAKLGPVDLDEKTRQLTCKYLIEWHLQGVFDHQSTGKHLNALAKILDPAYLASRKEAFKQPAATKYPQLKAEKLRAAGHLKNLASQIEKQSAPESKWLGLVFQKLATELEPVKKGRWDAKLSYRDWKTYIDNFSPVSDEQATYQTMGLVVQGGSFVRVGEFRLPTGGMLPLKVHQIPKSEAFEELFVPANCGSDFTKSARIAFDHVKSIRPILAGNCFRINPGEIPVDGGSAGCAMAMLFLAHADGLTLDSDVCVTGAILPNGSAKPVGGVYSKATASNKKIIAIPSTNQSEIRDFVHMNKGKSLGGLWERQVFTYGSVEQLVNIARVDRAENLKEAMELFRSTGEQASKLPAEEKIKNLQKVVSLAPNHLSARVILETLTTNPKPLLSLSTSLYIIDGYMTQLFATYNVAGIEALRKQITEFRKIAHPTVATWAATVASAIDDIAKNKDSQQAWQSAHSKLNTLSVTVQRMLSDQELLTLLNSR